MAPPPIDGLSPLDGTLPAVPTVPSMQMPTPEQMASVALPELPRPGRRGADQSVAIPFDPMGYHTFQSLQEVKPESAATKGQADAARRRANFLPKFLTLESMYSQNPTLQSQGTLRIERIEPHWWSDAYGQQVKVRGLIAYGSPSMSTEQFIHTYGGFKYRVYGMLLQENRENGGGPPSNVDVAVAEFEVPMSPNLDNLPVAEMPEQSQNYSPDAAPMPVPMMNMNMFQSPYGRRQGGPTPMGMYYPQQQQPQQPQNDGSGVIAPVLGFAREMLGRQQQQPMYQQAPPTDSFVNAISQQARTSQEVIQQSSQQQMSMMQSQMDRLYAQLEEERRRNQEMNNRPADVVQMVEGMSKLVSAQKGGADSDLVRQMRDDHERSLRLQREESERQFTRQTADFERAISRANDEKRIQGDIYERRIGDLEKALDRSQREAREEVERRENMVRNEMQRMMDSRDREMAQRIADIKDMHERELRMTTTVQETTRSTTEQAHAIEMRSVQGDLAKISAELREKAEMVQQHLADKNKPLLEQVQEVTQLHDMLQQVAGVDKDDEDDDKPTEERKWYDSPVVRDMAKVAVAKGADLIPQLQALISKQSAPGSMPPPQMGMVPPQMQQGPILPPRPMRQAMPRLPQRRPKPISFADPEAPPLRDTEPQQQHFRRHQPPPHTPANLRAVTVPEPLSVFEGGAMPQPQMQPQPRPSAMPASMPPPAAQMAPQQAPQAAPAANEDWSAFEWMPMEVSAVKPIIEQLEMQCRQKIPVDTIALAMLEQFPLELVQSLPSIIEIGRFVETIRTCPMTANLALATGKGRRFLQDLWASLTKHAAAAAAEKAKAAGEEPEEEEDEEAKP